MKQDVKLILGDYDTKNFEHCELLGTSGRFLLTRPVMIRPWFPKTERYFPAYAFSSGL